MRRLEALARQAVRSLVTIWRRQNEFGKVLMAIGAVNAVACLLLVFNLVIYTALPWRAALGARDVRLRVPTASPELAIKPTRGPSPTGERTPTPTLSPTPTTTPTPTRTPTRTPTKLPTLRPSRIEVTARMSDSSPRRTSVVTVYGEITKDGKGIAGVPMQTDWLFSSVTMHCDDRSDDDGVASCSFPLLLAAKGQYVTVRVTFVYDGKTYSATTGFTPR